uniref:Uncharacterized protein n=1 Tax=Arundo donax TaxID=35708 RepID=A0A0A9H7S3_ARUDO
MKSYGIIIIMKGSFLQQSQSRSSHPTASWHMRERTIGIQNMMHISLHNAIHQTNPLIMPRNTTHHLISIEKVHGVKSKIPPKNTLSCFIGTPTKSGTVPFLVHN